MHCLSQTMELNLNVIFLFSAFTLFEFPTATNALGNVTDQVALLKFKESIANDPHGILRSWNDSVQFCKWPGITCSRLHGRVTALNLQSYDFKGTITPFIANLTSLRYINLENNTFFGEIPPEVGQLYRLQHLKLSNNTLGGKIPVSLINCSQLRIIELNWSRLVGEIPYQLGSLVKLEAFRVFSNDLTGIIPPSVGNLSSTSFRILSTGYNNLVGGIPSELGGLRSLNIFGAATNKLSGTIPPSFYNLSSICAIAIALNNISGNLPANLGFSFRNLQILAIAGNGFFGPIPISLFINASRLQLVDLSNNNFVGELPNLLGNLQDLRWLSVGKNYMGGNSSSDWGFLTSLTNCSNLERLILDSNNFGGVLPNSIGNLSTKLNYLILRKNYIYGNIPASLANLVNLNRLDLGYNLFTGAIPKSLGKLQKLQGFSAHRNRLSGEIPSSLGNLTQLVEITLFDNRLEGSIPPTIGNCQNLQKLDFSNNKLTGEIPLQIFSLASLTLLLNLSHNSLNGSLPVHVGKLSRLYTVDLSANSLSGEIPSAINGDCSNMECSNMEFIYLQRNFFYGNIPSTLSSMKGLVHLDLSQNNLSGRIPEEIQSLPFLLYLNISYNNLEGEVPRRGVFGNASAIFLTSNSRLCGGIPSLQLSPCPMRGAKRPNFQDLKLTITVTCVVLALILSFSAYSALHWWRKRREKSSSTLPIKELLPTVSYRALFEATRGFSPENLIGSGSFGSVYKAIFEQENKIVVVKVLNLEKKGASKGFEAECEALSIIRHRNLVKILTTCSSLDYNGNDFKALVFEFMENGSMEEWLHKDKEDQNRRNLNILQRLNIIMDVACALDYLHEHCEQPIIHCDVKPSNILLDKDMVAHLCDFGLARLLSNTKGRFRHGQTSTRGIKGSIGYVAPEFGMGGEASIQGDSYSFGILVLEILTGRRPTDEMFKDGLSLHNFVKTALPRSLMQILDQTLLSKELEERDQNETQTQRRINRRNSSLMEQNLQMDANIEKCLVSLLNIGLACSVESPKERLKIRIVNRELHFIKNVLLVIRGLITEMDQGGLQCIP